ncbi:MAG: Citrate synthase [Candidatus Methanofastidiosum methylothiophilum]|uniref:Citrate synthase n=1 Tax=Candidatus Methanofastidiosum methylothiophilum TaxID=1705564 RepID=A0A150J542_9EURY|nr:MAG: Citrate synthase [Candidatus Methanofastidiosum methylthiophilus]NMC76572.1 citrate/2-methylcitrate synthase [Candidatus Methanofastidiosa archaeon]
MFERLVDYAKINNQIAPELYPKYDVKRGLRNEDGSGVLVGLTKISDVTGYEKKDGVFTPLEGRLAYRGININDIVEAISKENRHGFEEIIFLLLFGKLPTWEELEYFNELLVSNRDLAVNFTNDVILHFPSNDIMNKLARSVLVLYALDKKADDTSIENVLRQSIGLIAKFPSIVAYAYHARRHYFKGKDLVLRNQNPEYSVAENFLYMLREDGNFTKLEADTLDILLILHAEHGGGNNSTFTVHVVTSSGTDTYSAISAGIGSLKGPLHGGANKSVMAMMKDIKDNVNDWEDEEELKNYLKKILERKAFDGAGVIYGLGHAIYTKSDPRTIILKKKARELAKDKKRMDEFKLYELIEQTAPEVFYEVKKSNKVITANVDFYSGFVYNCLDIPKELYTPLFAMGRIPGWCAHRIEELISGKKIIRPAYAHVGDFRPYQDIDQRI